jgi:hypothetical protein
MSECKNLAPQIYLSFSFNIAVTAFTFVLSWLLYERQIYLYGAVVMENLISQRF